MSAEQLFNLWRECGDAFWHELSPAQQKQWDWVYRGVKYLADDKYNEGSRDGWDEGYEQAREEHEDA